MVCVNPQLSNTITLTQVIPVSQTALLGSSAFRPYLLHDHVASKDNWGVTA